MSTIGQILKSHDRTASELIKKVLAIKASVSEHIDKAKAKSIIINMEDT